MDGLVRSVNEQTVKRHDIERLLRKVEGTGTSVDPAHPQVQRASWPQFELDPGAKGIFQLISQGDMVGSLQHAGCVLWLSNGRYHRFGVYHRVRLESGVFQERFMFDETLHDAGPKGERVNDIATLHRELLLYVVNNEAMGPCEDCAGDLMKCATPLAVMTDEERRRLALEMAKEQIKARKPPTLDEEKKIRDLIYHCYPKFRGNPYAGASMQFPFPAPYPESVSIAWSTPRSSVSDDDPDELVPAYDSDCSMD